MLKVKCVDPETVDLPDISDKVYFGQEKIFSESQYSRSQDLKKEIKKGRLIVIYRGEETFADFKLPSSTTIERVPIPADNTEELKNILSEEFAAINDKMSNLESQVANVKPVEIKSTDASLIEQLLSAIKNISTPSSNVQMESIKSQLDKLSDKISDLSVQAKPQEITEENIEKRMEEIYVPNITVEDSSNNVNLEVRVVEKKDSLKDSLDKLKKLRKSE